VPAPEGSRDPTRRSGSGAILAALACLYLAQGIPFGFATEYLPVVLREQRYSYSAIAALSWLQLPWQLKIFWAKAADHPRLRARTRFVILAMQLALTLVVAAFAGRPLREAPVYWFVLTAIAAAIAATQDVFVDAFAVRVLRPEERGFGNSAQVAGYRAGMLIGGAALLTFVGTLGEGTTLLVCAGFVLVASLGAFVSSEAAVTERAESPAKPTPLVPFIRQLFRREAVAVIVLAATYKLGLHMASSLLKPMAVDYHWTKEQIGIAVVTFGTGGALVGSVTGGVVHRVLKEKRALFFAGVLQALVCLPLIAVDRMHAPLGLTTAVFAFEHFASGLGTTVLFAALMSATRPSDAGLHYTVLTSANALAIGVGGLLGAGIADLQGKSATFAVAAIVSAAPLLLLRRWNESVEASRS
jgi:MFS transporter, PAT family, beta-lactamase induction signal transducer AmpG